VAPTEDGKRKAETKKINDKQEAEKARKSEKKREGVKFVCFMGPNLITLRSTQQE
jgi:hypothetical protein